MTTAIEAFAPAKINLTLHVTGQRDDGYHLLDSLVVFADVGDHLSLTPAPELSMKVSGPFAQGVPTDASNLVWRALVASNWTGHVHLEKNLPHGAGLGGGSADAAAVLRAFHGEDVQSGLGLENTLALGADVPVCVRTGAQRMQGIGEVLAQVEDVPELHMVLVNPGVPVSTPRVFNALETRTNAPMVTCGGWQDRLTFMTWLRAQRNDLEQPAWHVAPVIGEVLRTLSDAELARMSGSGATCFGIYPNAAAARFAAERIKADQPNWWCVACKTINGA